jgi:hypothetical protein
MSPLISWMSERERLNCPPQNSAPSRVFIGYNAGRKHLDRHVAVKPLVVCAIYLAHATGAELVNYSVMA